MSFPNWTEAVAGNEPAPLLLGPLTRTDFVRYQGASGDMNPIHHDEPFARAAGFEAPLGVGMFPAGALANWAADWLGPERVRRTRIRWKAPVWPGDTLTLVGVVVSRDEAAKRLEMELSCTNQDDVVTCQAWLSFAFGEGIE